MHTFVYILVLGVFLRLIDHALDQKVVVGENGVDAHIEVFLRLFGLVRLADVADYSVLVGSVDHRLIELVVEEL